ncbi:MAG: hypothetical protein HC837_18455 [Chloroflexaceae bacterium]|nr:hypothetical protein [Chloroflexaceae bacterium]
MNAIVATELGKYAQEHLGPEWRIYFSGLPRMYVGFASLPYLAPEVERVDLRDPLEKPPRFELIQSDKHAAFVILPERSEDLKLVMRQFPGGVRTDIMAPDAYDDQPLFVLYRVPRSLLTDVVKHDISRSVANIMYFCSLSWSQNDPLVRKAGVHGLSLACHFCGIVERSREHHHTDIISRHVILPD